MRREFAEAGNQIAELDSDEEEAISEDNMPGKRSFPLFPFPHSWLGSDEIEEESIGELDEDQDEDEDEDEERPLEEFEEVDWEDVFRAATTAKPKKK